MVQIVRVLFLVDVASGVRGHTAVDMAHRPRAVDVELQPLWSDFREAAHSSASSLRNRVLRDYEAEVGRWSGSLPFHPPTDFLRRMCSPFLVAKEARSLAA